MVSDQLRGLGKKFISSADHTFRSIQSHPLRYPLVHRNIRRALLQHFPYGVFFIREENSIIVLAVLHQARDPNRWRKRIRTRLWHT